MSNPGTTGLGNTQSPPPTKTVTTTNITQPGGGADGLSPSPFLTPDGGNGSIGPAARLAMGAAEVGIKSVLQHIAKQDRESIKAFHRSLSSFVEQIGNVAEFASNRMMTAYGMISSQSISIPTFTESSWAMRLRQIIAKDLSSMKPPVNYWPVHSPISYQSTPSHINGQIFALNSSFTISSPNHLLTGVSKNSKYLLYFHGGAFITGSGSWFFYKDFVRRIMTTAYDVLTKRSLQVRGPSPKPPSLVCISIDYRLIPDNPFPAALLDGVAAYQYLVENLGVSPSQIIIGGDSAGGHLAATVTLALQRLGAPQPAGLVLFSPWLDVSLSGQSVKELKANDPLLPADSAPVCTRAMLGVIKSKGGAAWQSGFLPYLPPTPKDIADNNFPKDLPRMLPTYSVTHPAMRQVVEDPTVLSLPSNDMKRVLEQAVASSPQHNKERLDETPVYALLEAARSGLSQLERHPLASPIYAPMEALRKLPPTLLITGGREILLDDSTRFFQALSTAAVSEPKKSQGDRFSDALSGWLTKMEEEQPILEKIIGIGRDIIAGKRDSLEVLGKVGGTALRQELIRARDELDKMITQIDTSFGSRPVPGRSVQLTPDQSSGSSAAAGSSSDEPELKQEAHQALKEIKEAALEAEGVDLDKWSARSLRDESLGANKFWRMLESVTDNSTTSDPLGLRFLKPRISANPVSFVSIPPPLHEHGNGGRENNESSQELKTVPYHQLSVWPGMMHTFSLFGMMPGAYEARSSIAIAADFAAQVWQRGDATRTEPSDGGPQSNSSEV